MLKVNSLLDMVQSDKKDGKGTPKTKKMKKHLEYIMLDNL
jgi:hypothetical protein